MNLSSIGEKRRLVPRWRKFKNTFINNVSPTPINHQSDIDGTDNLFLISLLEIWEKEKSIKIAAEIVFHAITNNNPNIAKDQASFLLKNKKNLPEELLNLSKKLLGSYGTHTIETEINNVKLIDLKSRIYSEISNYKKKLHEWPRNAIFWTEKARLYTAIGEIIKARQAINIALSLASENRYVVRCAIRYFIHIGDFEAIYNIFSKQTDLYKDPWILAPYVALQDKLKKSTLKIKLVRSLIDNMDDQQTTELTGSLASLELENGSTKSSKKLFLKSATMPNDNSLAQLAWVENKLGRLTNINNYDIPFIHEAKTRDAFSVSKFDLALKSSIEWMIDEPFSSTPATSGSFIASSFLDNLKCAKDFCEIGLNANPTDTMLLNNYTVILARSGNIRKAYEEFKKIGKVELHSRFNLTKLATTGLLLMRSDFLDEGRENYENAIGLSKKLGLKEMQSLVAINYAEEEYALKNPDIKKIKGLLTENIQKQSPKHIVYLDNKIRKRLATKRFVIDFNK